jgi:hypothetical protein
MTLQEPAPIERFGPITSTLADAAVASLRSVVLGVNYGVLLAERQGNFSKMPPMTIATCGESLNSFKRGVEAAYLAVVMAERSKGSPADGKVKP